MMFAFGFLTAAVLDLLAVIILRKKFINALQRLS